MREGRLRAAAELAANGWQTRQWMVGVQVAHRGLITVDVPEEDEPKGDRDRAGTHRCEETFSGRTRSSNG
jgi:hypothetical protein